MRTQDLYLYTLNTIKQGGGGAGVSGGGVLPLQFKGTNQTSAHFGVLDVSDAVLPIRIR